MAAAALWGEYQSLPPHLSPEERGEKMRALISIYRSYRKDGVPRVRAFKGAILWSGILKG